MLEVKLIHFSKRAPGDYIWAIIEELFGSKLGFSIPKIILLLRNTTDKISFVAACH